MKISILFFLLLFSFFNLDAKELKCGDPQTALYFANGMFNDKASAKTSIFKLVALLNKKYPELGFKKSKVAYNTSEFSLLQFYQVYRQKNREQILGLWSQLMLAFSKDIKSYQDSIKTFNNNESLIDKDLKRQIEGYKKDLKDGLKIITVAHSQGNFYTNSAFGAIGSENTKMISVATPADKVYFKAPTNSIYSGGAYFTFESDTLIASIPGALPPNIVKNKPGYFDHGFINHYLKDNDSRDAILDEIEIANKALINHFDHMDPAIGFFNSDLNPVLKWFGAKSRSTDKLSLGECLVAASLFKVYSLHGLNCQERKLDIALESIADCRKGFESNFSGGLTSCPHILGLKLYEDQTIDFFILGHEDYYDKHPECRMYVDEYRKNGVSQVIAAENIMKSILNKEDKKQIQ